MGLTVLLLTTKSSYLLKSCQAPDVAADSCTVLNWLPSLLAELHTWHARDAGPGSDASMQEPHAWSAGSQHLVSLPLSVCSLDFQAAALFDASCMLVQQAGTPRGSTTAA